MKDSREECNASKCSTINGSVEYHADNSLFIADGKFTFVPKTSWWGLNLLTLMKEFLGLRAYATALSHWQLTSSLTFKRIPVKIALCRSHIPLQPGNSADAVDIFILTLLQNPENSSERNSPIITKYFRWTAKYTNPVLKKVLNNNSRVFAFNNGEFIDHGSTKYFY